MKTIDWMDLPEVALETIDEVERDGQPILVTRNGKGIVRIGPVDEATMALFQRRDVTAG
jgi:antitoxin (DNA-binding transcriptional repressor) of toxin-antitoxin stability system